MKKIALILVSCLVSTLLFAAVLEVILRLGFIQNQLYDRRHIHGKEIHPKYRLLIIGDSFFLPRSLLGSLLYRDLKSYDVAVLNVATSGTGPFEYLEEMKTVGTEFKPDIVLLSYYIGNDLTNVQNHPKFNSGQKKNEQTGLAINSSSTRSFFRHLYLYHYLLRASQRFRRGLFPYEEKEMKRAGIPPDLIEDAKMQKINPWLLRLAIYDKNNLLDNLSMETDENMRAWYKVRELLTAVYEICKQSKALLVIVAFPDTLQVNESQFDFFKQLQFNIDERTLNLAKPQLLLLEFCKEKNILCLDLLPTFRARRNEEFYRDKDEHLNDAGNHLAAELILDFLLQKTTIAEGVKTLSTLGGAFDTYRAMTLG